MIKRLCCHFCGKSVTTEFLVPNENSFIIRAIVVCPECIDSGQVIIPDKK